MSPPLSAVQQQWVDEQDCVMSAALEGESPGSMSEDELPSTNDTTSLDCLQRLDKCGFARYNIWQKRRPSVSALSTSGTHPYMLAICPRPCSNTPLECRVRGAHSACACRSVW